MKTTRRGFVGIVTGAAAAAVVGIKEIQAEVKAIEPQLRKVVPSFKIDARTGPPFVAGDVLRKIETGEMFLVKPAEGPRERVIGDRVMTVRDADPGWLISKRLRDDPVLVLVPFLLPTAPGAPLEAFKHGELIRVGTTYNEGRPEP